MKQLNGDIAIAQELTQRQQKVLIALLEHGSVRLAVKETGISRTTIWHYQQIPEFQRRLKEARKAISDETTALLQRASYAAGVRLVQLMNESGVQPAVQFAAAKTVLDMAYRGQDLKDLEESVEELKESSTPNKRLMAD